MVKKNCPIGVLMSQFSFRLTKFTFFFFNSFVILIRSGTLRPSRDSSRTQSVSPSRTNSNIFFSPWRSMFLPDNLSMKIFSAPHLFSAAICRSSCCSMVDTRTYPIFKKITSCIKISRILVTIFFAVFLKKSKSQNRLYEHFKPWPDTLYTPALEKGLKNDFWKIEGESLSKTVKIASDITLQFRNLLFLKV